MRANIRENWKNSPARIRKTAQSAAANRIRKKMILDHWRGVSGTASIR